MNGKAFLTMFSSVAFALALNATTYTSASYVQNGLIAQWDGIDNQGTGTHDPTATTWKDLKGNNDLTIVDGLHATGRNAEWRRGIGLYFNTYSLGKAVAYGTETATTYKTIEIVCKVSGSKSRILFWSGTQSRYIVFDDNQNNPTYTPDETLFKRVYFDGTKNTKYRDGL